MIDLYTWGTPNGRKVSIMLEEVGLPYTVHKVNIGEEEQFAPEFIKISPWSKIPAIVDPDGPGGEPISLMESGAILIYLAEKTESSLLPTEPRARYSVLQWLMLQIGGVGPLFGQAHHFLKFAKHDVPYGKARYKGETLRLYGVLDVRLEESAFLAGDDLSIADIATYPWVARHEWHQADLDEYPSVKRWFNVLTMRPTFEAGMKVPFLN